MRHWPIKAASFVLLCGLPLVAGSALWRQGTPWVLAVYCAASLLSFLQYRTDKRSAEARRSRVPENALHLVEAAGGWPGALLAQQAFRHKTRKVSYQIVFWLIVSLHQIYWLYFIQTGLSTFPHGGGLPGG